MPKNRRSGPPTPSDLDPLIHERLRLGMICSLAVHDSLTFTELRGLLQTTDGNLSVQARRLEEAGYVSCMKRFQGRKPKTIYKLTSRGRGALEGYLEVLSEMLPAPARSSKLYGATRAVLRALPAES